MTYYQKKRVIAKLKRIANYIKYHDCDEHTYTALYVIDKIIRAHLDEPCEFHRTKALPRRVWADK